MRPFRVLRLSKVLKFYKNSAIFQAFLCPTLPSKRPPESVGEQPCIFNLVPANLRRDTPPCRRVSPLRRRRRLCRRPSEAWQESSSFQRPSPDWVGPTRARLAGSVKRFTSPTTFCSSGTSSLSCLILKFLIQRRDVPKEDFASIAVAACCG